jgi:hypothetical protein
MDPAALAEAITAAAAALPVSAAQAKLPSFWRNQAELWFVRAEAEFETARVTVQNTQYSLVVKALPEEIAVDVKHLLTVRPADRPYDTLKEAVIKVCQATEADRVRRFNALSLGDQRPSQLLRRMRDLQPVGDDSPWYRHAFLAKLPAALQLHLAATRGDLEAIAEAADTLVATLQLQPAAAAAHVVQQHDGGGGGGGGGVRGGGVRGGGGGDDGALQADLAAVYTRHGRKPPQQQQQTADAKRQQRPFDPNKCFFHNRFGVKARKCVSPCSAATAAAASAAGN